MTDLERLALTTVFIAAVVVAGLALSYVPHVELVTVVVFSGGVLLGSRGGALVGATGMVLYVLANSALRGFPPSPLPILAAQAAAMTLVGVAGGWWRRFWLWGGVPRRGAVWLLPAVGLSLAFLNQAILNAAFAHFLAAGETGRGAVFLSGMAFGLVDMGVNAVVFAVAGPQVVSLLRRTARRRGWWGAAPGAILAVVLVAALPAGPAAAQRAAPAPADSLGDESGRVEETLPAAAAEDPRARPDSLGAGSGADAQEAGPAPRRRLRLVRRPLHQPVPMGEVAGLGLPSLQDGRFWTMGERSRTSAPAMASTLDRWALGWGRVRYGYDGLPLSGPVHDYGEPPDLPMAWRGSWAGRWNASGTNLDLPAPAPAGERPLSQIALNTGSSSRRTAEFLLFRNLGPVNLGINFRDRLERGFTVLDESDGSRVWLRLESAAGKRPDWTLDLSLGNEENEYFDGVDRERTARRIQASLRGPFLAGETRVALQLRRHALQLRGLNPSPGELRMDGFTLQADWAAPVRDLTLRLGWDRDRRRGVLSEDRTFDGVRLTGLWAREWTGWSVGGEATAGHQEPYGFTWSGTAAAEAHRGAWGGRVSVSHEEDLPAMVLGVDRAYPDADALAAHLAIYEAAESPEQRTSVRVESAWEAGPLYLNLGGWYSTVRGYLVESNPVWVPVISFYAPRTPPPRDADVLGAYGELRLDLFWGLFVAGSGRVHGRGRDDVPFLTPWLGDGALHWKRFWFSGSLDLDVALGGVMLGPRRTPLEDEYPASGLGYVRLLGRIGNGILSLSFENLTDSYQESDLRYDDVVSPVPVAGRTFALGLTMFLTD